MRILPEGITLALSLCLPLAPAFSATVTVHPGQSIQSAVYAANPGDTILILPGTYSEQVQISTNSKGVALKGLSLVGTAGAILNGPSQPATTGIDVEADNVTVTGLTIQNYNTGIQAGVGLANNDRIIANLLTNNAASGAYLFYGANDTDFELNTVIGNGDGIDDAGTGAYFENNILAGNTGFGFSDAGTSSYDYGSPVPYPDAVINHLDHNLITQNGLGGIDLDDAEGVSVTHNIITSNAAEGIYCYYGTVYCTVSHNEISGNQGDGIYLYSNVFDCTFTHNASDNNDDYGYEVSGGATGNVFSHDSGEGNKTLDAIDRNGTGANTWTHDDFGTSSPANLGK